MARIVVERDPETAEAAGAAVLAGLQAFNRRTLGEIGGELVSVSVRDDEGAIVGGGVGEVGLGYLFVKYLWVDESLRGRDLGARVLGQLEDEARRLGAARSYVDTFSFQAPGFYGKQGYREFGRLDDFPPGHSRFWMMKAL
jgi:GNAT superfamily N-acetyltransferase